MLFNIVSLSSDAFLVTGIVIYGIIRPLNEIVSIRVTYLIFALNV